MKIQQSQLINWEKEIKEYEVITDELNLFESMQNETNPVIKSRLLSLAALSRKGRNKSDTLTRVWMEKALQLDPANTKASTYLLEFDWLKFKDVLTPLSFPLIRETDNRTAKKKTAEEYINICQTFLNQADDVGKEITEKAELARKINLDNGHDRFHLLSNLLLSAIETIGSLLKAAQEYDQSITGVFHTAIYFEDIQLKLTQLENLKSEWGGLFDKQVKEPVKNTENPLEELNEMIGMEKVKSRVNDYYRFLKYQKHRKELGFQMKDEMSLHMILTGNPGTGKTTLARLFAKIYHELGVLPSKEVIEVDRSHLVGSYVGQTEENVRAAVERAIGGVLFVDEAYSLKREGQTGNDYGQTAIDTLVSLMTGSEFGGKFAVILAGYPDEMRAFIDANPGLRSRFPASNFIHLPNYSNAELLKIAKKIAEENDYFLTEDAKVELDHRLDQERVDDTFGNARTVQNLVLEAIFKKGAALNDVTEDIVNMTLLTKEDFLFKQKEIGKSPSEGMDKLIGMTSIKKEIHSLISFVKMQQFRRKNGLPTIPIQLHAIFTGNPGTGKTTVAKLFAELLRECDVLKRGHLIVAGRADFVAGYVGQTAIKTKKKIRESLGGVLFIDEAYSLFSSSSSDFGKEVIDTLVEEMTRHNENIAVILAGYPNEMENLLESNPGLRSRFKKFFHFPDYTTEELLEIMVSYAARYQYQISDFAKNRLLEAVQAEKVEGNGRFATNLVDEMIQAQALRLMGESIADDLAELAVIIEEEDVMAALKNMGIFMKG